MADPVWRRSCTVKGLSGSFVSSARPATVWVTLFNVAFDMQRSASQREGSRNFESLAQMCNATMMSSSLLRQVDFVGLAGPNANLRNRPDRVSEIHFVTCSLDQLALAHERQQDQAQGQADGRQGRGGVQHPMQGADFGWRQCNGP